MAVRVLEVMREVWGDEFVAAFVPWVDEMIREQIEPGQALWPLSRARKIALVRRAPSFLRETLSEEGVSELVDWLAERREKWARSRPEEESGNQVIE